MRAIDICAFFTVAKHRSAIVPVPVLAYRSREQLEIIIKVNTSVSARSSVLGYRSKFFVLDWFLNNMLDNLNLPTPSSFPAFPFNPPYEIQVELMRHLYSSIEDKKVTIIESPTGTVSVGRAHISRISDAPRTRGKL